MLIMLSANVGRNEVVTADVAQPPARCIAADVHSTLNRHSDWTPTIRPLTINPENIVIIISLKRVSRDNTSRRDADVALLVNCVALWGMRARYAGPIQGKGAAEKE